MSALGLGTALALRGLARLGKLPRPAFGLGLAIVLGFVIGGLLVLMPLLGSGLDLGSASELATALELGSASELATALELGSVPELASAPQNLSVLPLGLGLGLGCAPELASAPAMVDLHLNTEIPA